MNVITWYGAYLSYIEDYTRLIFVYLISHNSKALGCLRFFLNLIENQKEKTLKSLQTDGYLSVSIKEFCEN